MPRFLHTYRTVVLAAVLMLCTAPATTVSAADKQHTRRPTAASPDSARDEASSAPDIVSTDSLSGAHAAFAVRNLLPGGITADPGTAQIILAKLTGRFSPNTEFSETVTAPPGWFRFPRATMFSVRKQSDLLRMIPVSIPKNAAAGTYAIVYSVRSRAAAADRDSASFTVTVRPREEYEIEITRTPQFTIDGSPLAYELTVRNAGNTTSPVYLSLKSSKGYTITTACDSLRIAPRQRVSVAVAVQIGAVERKEPHILDAAIVSSLTGREVAAASVSTDIIPRHGTAEIPYILYPVTMKLAVLHDEKHSALQGEVSGAGYLDEGKTHRLSLLVRGPNTQNRIENGQRDEYRVSYQHDKFRLRGGDLSFSLSPLLEAGRYATGGEASFAADNFSLMTYYAYDRWSSDRHEQAGGSVSTKISDGVIASANLLQKNDDEKSTAVSAQASVQPFAGHQLNLEYGLSRSNAASGSGYMFDFKGNFRNTTYDLKKISGGSGFAGYVKDQDMLAANVSHYFDNDMRIEFSGRKDNRNVNGDSALPGGSSTFYQVGTGYGNLISLYLRQQGDRIAYPGQSFTRDQQSIQLRSGVQWNRWNFLTSVEYGLLTVEHQAERFPQQRYGAQASVQIDDRSNVSVNVDYAQQNQSGDSIRTDQLMGGFSAFLNFSDAFTLRVYGTMSQQIGAGENISGTLESALQYEFSRGHHIQLRGRFISIPTLGNDRFSGALEYSLPLSVPVGRVDNVGILSGALKDENGTPVPNVIISAGGLVTVTDRDGRFIFSSIAPGENYILVDRATMGVDRITLQDNPMTVNVPKGDETTVALTAVAAGKISGIVDLYGYENTGYIDSTQRKLTRLGGAEGVFVELKNSREVYRKVTDIRGNFSFTDLKPGDYSLSVSTEDLPDYHQFDRNDLSIVVAAGENKEAGFKIVPVARTIKIIKRGKLG